jgi:hypothetical protein
VVSNTITYLVAFFQVVVINCATNSQNWESCSDFNAWLIPGIQEAYNVITNPCPYCDEQDALQERRDLQAD